MECFAPESPESIDNIKKDNAQCPMPHARCPIPIFDRLSFDFAKKLRQDDGRCFCGWPARIGGKAH
ncbi:MAG: hypothetical protein F6J93_05430 [Oscillatoria sp. SIO1A7]|nr:hypothetical protein [Oscillatoria sp. SIO1A7]